MLEDLFQPTHLILVLVVVLLVFGPDKLPELGRSLGQGIRDFKKAFSDDGDSPRESAPKRPEEVETAK